MQLLDATELINDEAAAARDIADTAAAEHELDEILHRTEEELMQHNLPDELAAREEAEAQYIEQRAEMEEEAAAEAEREAKELSSAGRDDAARAETEMRDAEVLAAEEEQDLRSGIMLHNDGSFMDTVAGMMDDTGKIHLPSGVDVDDLFI